MKDLFSSSQSVRSGMDDANKAVEDKLAARARIREKKVCFYLASWGAFHKAYAVILLIGFIPILTLKFRTLIGHH